MVTSNEVIGPPQPPAPAAIDRSAVFASPPLVEGEEYTWAAFRDAARFRKPNRILPILLEAW